MILAMLYWPVAALSWIFIFWVLWMIVKCLRGIDQGVKEIAAILRDKP